MNFWLRFFPKLNQHPLSYRLLAYVVLCSSLFALLATATQLYLDYRRDVSALYKSFSFIQKSYLHAISVSTFKIDTDHLKLELEGALKLPDIVYLEVRELRGNQIYTHSKGNPNATKIIRKEYPLEYVGPTGEKRLMGTLVVTASLEGVYQRLWSRVITILATNIVKTFLASACILAIIYFLITRHLTRMANFTQQLVPGVTNHRLTLNRKPSQPDVADELEQVVKAINNLQDRSAQDIAIRKKTEEKLIHAEQKYRTVADFTYDWEYWSNNEGSLEYVSPSCGRISGYSVQDFKENPALLREIILPEDKKTWDAHKIKAQKTLKPEEIQFRIQRKDGKIRWIEHVCQPVRDPQGVLLGLRASNRDVTARKQAELDAQRHRQELTHVSRVATLGELSASLAHELNQPLTAILSNAQAARRFLTGDTADPEEVNEILNDIINDDKRAADIIKRLRALMHKKELEFKLLDLNKVFQGVSELVNREAFTKNVSLVLDLAEDLPHVQGDAVHLEQVAINLILNGTEAMEPTDDQPGELRVFTAKHDENTVRVSVRDQGTGIDEAHITGIFEAFYTTKPEGMGMGLSICRSIIEAHGGRLWAENNPDKGATFSFTVPISKGDEA